MSRKGDVSRGPASKHAGAGRGKGSLGKTSLEGSKRSFCECYPWSQTAVQTALYYYFKHSRTYVHCPLFNAAAFSRVISGWSIITLISTPPPPPPPLTLQYLPVPTFLSLFFPFPPYLLPSPIYTAVGLVKKRPRLIADMTFTDQTKTIGDLYKMLEDEAKGKGVKTQTLSSLNCPKNKEACK